MNIGIDVDEVVCDLLSSILDSIHLKWGVKNTISTFAEYNFFSNNYTECDETNKSIAEDIIAWVNDTAYLYNAPPYYGVSETIKKLFAFGHDVHFITARPEAALLATQKWFDTHAIPYTSLHALGHGSNKGLLGRQLGLNVYIDDHAVNIESMLEHTKAVNFLIDRPYNKWYINSKVIRISKLQDIFKYIDKEIAA
ncbi:MAG TPA: hypothetical protein VI911_07660 [Patescibacteria group bacterium]|nr:hypothetical protein [Patescibacteria group bacterium]